MQRNPNNQTPEYVYILIRECGEMMKIGETTSLPSRYNTLNPLWNFNIKESFVIATEPGSNITLEKTLHKIFKSNKIDKNTLPKQDGYNEFYDTQILNDLKEYLNSPINRKLHKITNIFEDIETMVLDSNIEHIQENQTVSKSFLKDINELKNSQKKIDICNIDKSYFFKNRNIFEMFGNLEELYITCHFKNKIFNGSANKIINENIMNYLINNNNIKDLYYYECDLDLEDAKNKYSNDLKGDPFIKVVSSFENMIFQAEVRTTERILKLIITTDKYKNKKTGLIQSNKKKYFEKEINPMIQHTNVRLKNTINILKRHMISKKEKIRREVTIKKIKLEEKKIEISNLKDEKLLSDSGYTYYSNVLLNEDFQNYLKKNNFFTKTDETILHKNQISILKSMKNYFIKNNLLTLPQRSLIGSW